MSLVYVACFQELSKNLLSLSAYYTKLRREDYGSTEDSPQIPQALAFEVLNLYPTFRS